MGRDTQDKHPGNRRDNDRRQDSDPRYPGPERRVGDRRASPREDVTQ